VIAATNVNVRQSIAARRFREDLYYRLSTFVFNVPPLRERPEDIPVLLRMFVANTAARSGVSPRPITQWLLARCLEHTWPGNVRELENFAKRYLILGDDDPATHHSDMPAAGPIGDSAPDAGDEPPANLKAQVRDQKQELEASAILQTLQRTNWNRKAAAKLLQISYKSLLLKVHRYGLDRQNAMPQHDSEQVQREVEKAFLAGVNGL
jgi:DNA-binding NtrC family response regulator